MGIEKTNYPWHYWLLLLVYVLFPSKVNGQAIDSLGKSNPIFSIEPYGGGGIPLASLADRFGAFSNFGLRLARQNPDRWVYGAYGDFYASATVHHAPLDGHKDSQGRIIGTNGRSARVDYAMRGYGTGLFLGKVFPLPLLGAVGTSGLRVTGALGYFWHKIHVQDQLGLIAQLADERVKAYDHLRGGWQGTVEVGYLYFSNSRTLNFQVSILGAWANTRSLRDYSFAPLPGQDSPNQDLHLGARLAWVIPIRGRKSNEEAIYFY